MQPFWCWLVTKVPLWLAPNLITFIGLVINIITTFPVLLLDRNAQGLVSEIVNCFVFSPHLGGGWTKFSLPSPHMEPLELWWCSC